MSYTLYIKNHCPGCSRALRQMEDLGLSFQVVNIEDEPSPESVFIVPALYASDKLLAYGPDIPAALEK